MPAMCRILFGPSVVPMALSRDWRVSTVLGGTQRIVFESHFGILSCVKNTWKDFGDFLKHFVFMKSENWVSNHGLFFRTKKR